MTIRAFILGLAAVLGLALLDPYTGFIKGWAWNTSGHFADGPVFLLIFFTVGANTLIKLARRSWALSQAELMLVWCMLIVGAVVPTAGLQCHFMGVLAGPSYVARRPDVPWQETSLAAAPDALLVSKRPGDLVTDWYYEGMGDEGRLPWGHWMRPLGRWGLFILLLSGAVFFMCAVLRKQWVERERLQFPLARVPLEFAEGSEGPRLLPALCYERAFLMGAASAAAFRLLRAAPLLFGADAAWSLIIPFRDAFHGTPLEEVYLDNVDVWWNAVGFAYLVPADVSLSMWFFYLFGRVELRTAAALGSTLHYGGTWSDLMRWQMSGSYIVFTLGAVVMARRHLWDVARKALGMARRVDDTEEPVAYGAAFWGFMLSCAGVLAWLIAHGMRFWAAPALLFLWLCIHLVHARLVAQSGMYVTEVRVQPPSIIHGLSMGRAFGPAGGVIAQMQHSFMMEGSTALLAPAAISVFRIADVFRRRRRKMILPALLMALLVSLAASSYTTLKQAYGHGALNFSYDWGITANAKWVFDVAHQRMERGGLFEPAYWGPFSMGMALTGTVMFMRARFYWWPVHPIGLLGISGWHIDRLWVPFFLGWLAKTLLMKFASGRHVRLGRLFFIGVILAESLVAGISSVVSVLTGGAVPGF